MSVGGLLWFLAVVFALLALILHWAIDPWWGVLLLGVAGLGGMYLGDRKI